MSSRSLGSEPRESQGEAGPEGDAADVGATRGAPGHAGCSGPSAASCRAALLRRRFVLRTRAGRDSFATGGLRALTPLRAPRRSAWLIRRLHAPGVQRRAQRKRCCVRGGSHLGAVALCRWPTSLRWASTSSRSTCASPSLSSSPPRCVARAPGAHAHTRRARPSGMLTLARAPRAGPHPRHRQDGAHVQVREATPRYAVELRLLPPKALTFASLSPCRLDVDAGLETMKLVRDVGSPSLHRRVPALQRAAALALTCPLGSCHRRMNAAMESASRSLQRLKNGT